MVSDSGSSISTAGAGALVSSNSSSRNSNNVKSMRRIRSDIG